MLSEFSSSGFNESLRQTMQSAQQQAAKCCAVPIVAKTYFRVGEDNSTYDDKDIELGNNNILSMATGGIIAFLHTDVAMGPANWLYVTNRTTMLLDTSSLAAASYSVWTTESSSVSSRGSNVDLTDVAVMASRSRWNFTDSLWTFQFASGPARSMLWFDRSDISLVDTRATWTNAGALLSNSTLRLVDSTLQLVGNSDLELWASRLELVNSSIVLANGGTLRFSCGSFTESEGVIASDSLLPLAKVTTNITNTTGGQQQLGAADLKIENQMSGIIDLLGASSVSAGPSTAAAPPPSGSRSP
ncbi:hypothetical protein PLESTB_001618900 [Pleodorina starrii]|uniref:Uncharacterized protein n=1 Tax=Pleodorina starrii TaxID=330485 RepID=A0A9W6BYE9_9CHLO|nr:hypothetical protein PLESTM_001892100 [Pleodorina starrii]GLC60484.1 hypothetical protein PLESTB_001618900 [Pleodorina starrii]